MNIIGNVKGKTCIIVDDIIDSGGTIVNAVGALKKLSNRCIRIYYSRSFKWRRGSKIKKSKIKKLIITYYR